MDDTAEMFESKQWPYEEEKLLRYIDNEELPAYFVDILASQYSFLFYSGCVIAEVRDYRQAYPHFKCDIHHVLLKPSLQVIHRSCLKKITLQILHEIITRLF